MAAIADNAYFAQHATFPGVQGSLNAPHTPWILYGGSLAGAQTAFSIKQYGGDGGILWGGIASSGTTNAQLEYPEWYDQYQRVGPQDCIGYLNGIVDNMDKVFDKKNAADVHKLKALFGLEALTDNRDFAMTVAFPLGGPMNYPTNTWQELNWNKADSSDDFWNFCNNITDMDAPKEVNAADGALTQYSNGEAWTGLGRYANYVKKYIVPLCKGGNINSSGCFGTQNESYWANVANDDSRSYLYTTCTESGGYQTAHPRGPNLLSRVMKVDYTQVSPFQHCTCSKLTSSNGVLGPSPTATITTSLPSRTPGPGTSLAATASSPTVLPILTATKMSGSGCATTRRMRRRAERPMLVTQS